MSNLFWLTVVHVARLQPSFPKSRGRPKLDDQRVLSGIVFSSCNGLR
jgi:transposase